MDRRPHTIAEMLSQMRLALQEEIKAAQKDKRRYAELRWIPDTSPRLKVEG